jgi:hypothetical protein
MSVLRLYRADGGIVNKYDSVGGMRIGRGILGIRKK